MRPLSLLFFLTLFSFQLAAQVLYLEEESNHSTVGFRINIAGFTEVTGKFTDYDILVDLDETDFTQSKFSATIQAASINTGIPDRDEHLRTADFFDVEQYPLITFTSDSVRQVNYAQFVAMGRFSMHGVTRDIELPFTLVKKDGNTLGLKIRTTIDRIEYGIAKDFKHTHLPDFLAREIQVEIDFWTKKRKQE